MKKPKWENQESSCGGRTERRRMEREVRMKSRGIPSGTYTGEQRLPPPLGRGRLWEGRRMRSGEEERRALAPWRVNDVV